MSTKKKLLNDERGQGSLYSFFAIVMGLIMLAALLPVVNDIVGTIENSNMNNLSSSSTILLLIGMSGVLMTILFFISVITDFQTQQRYVG